MMKGDDQRSESTTTEAVAGPRRRAARVSAKLVESSIPALLSLALFSYGGELLRWSTEQLFGDACHKPETSTISHWAPCTSAPGTTEATGGVFFTDLPANVMGCFLMGVFVAGDFDMLPVDLPMAFLSRSNRFQNWKITHLGLRTGFCGALTSFSSWNTQMVVMLCGGIGTELGYSQWVTALWGYLVGWMIAIESFRLGREVAHALSRRNNPDLAREADVIREKEEKGIVLHVNRDLPDFERRFLYGIMIREEDIEMKARRAWRRSNLIDDYGSVSFRLSHSQPISQKDERLRRAPVADLYRYGSDTYQKKYHDCIHHLQRWKESTESHRKRGSNLTGELHVIEKTVLVKHQMPSPKALEVIQDAGWDFEALCNYWKDACSSQQVEGEIDDSENYSGCLELAIIAIAFVLATAFLAWGAIHFHDGTDPIEVNHRTQFFSALLAPPGTILRWWLSKWNGKLRHKRWEWLPTGTLAANVLACSIAALIPGIILSVDAEPLFYILLGAVKTGFAGSLSTASTFAAETVGLFRALPRYFWGFYYSFGSLLLVAVVGVISYVWAVA